MYRVQFTNTRSSGGTFRGVAGVQVAERRLRLVLGLDISDGRQIRPADEPTLGDLAPPADDDVEAEEEAGSSPGLFADPE